MAFARRLTGLVLALSLFAGLPVAAARAGCVCEHGHEGTSATEKPHTCTSACTAATCPMHRAAAAHSATDQDRSGDAVRCGCAGEARALMGQATVAGVLPARLALDAPIFARLVRTSISEAPRSLAASPPAPPPRA